MKWILAMVVVVGIGPAAMGQTIFEPVQYQYGEQSKFYYGGNDPAFFALGYGRGEQAWGQVNGFAFYSGDVEHFREVSQQPLVAFSDQLPYENAAIHGYNANDARLAAYANVPRYFRKGDLMSAGVVRSDGSSMPAQAKPIAVARRVAATQPSAAPILIIPKGQAFPAMRSNNVVIVRN